MHGALAAAEADGGTTDPLSTAAETLESGCYPHLSAKVHVDQTGTECGAAPSEASRGPTSGPWGARMGG